MKKIKVFFRILLLISFLAGMIYLAYSSYKYYKSYSKEQAKRQEVITDNLRENFIIRKEGFENDKSYKKKFDQLKKEDLKNVEGVVIVEE